MACSASFPALPGLCIFRACSMFHSWIWKLQQTTDPWQLATDGKVLSPPVLLLFPFEPFSWWSLSSCSTLSVAGRYTIVPNLIVPIGLMNMIPCNVACLYDHDASRLVLVLLQIKQNHEEKKRNFLHLNEINVWIFQFNFRWCEREKQRFFLKLFFLKLGALIHICLFSKYIIDWKQLFYLYIESVRDLSLNRRRHLSFFRLFVI